jgi:hypothetical protein
MPMEFEDEAAAAFDNEQAAEVPVHPVSQRIIEEERSPVWGEDTGEAPGSGSKTGSQFAATEGDAPPLTEGEKQGAKTEWERGFLAEATRNAKAPSEKELRPQEEQAEMDRQRRACESVAARVKAFAEKRGYDFPGTASGEAPAQDSASTLSKGQTQGLNSHPEEGPNKRAMRERFERLAAADRMEAARKAALAAKAVPLTPALSHRNGEEGEEPPDPLPDYAIWMRGQRA